MTPCERFKDKIFDLVDQELDGTVREQVLQHIEECPICCQFYRSLQSLKSGLKQIKPVEAPDSFQIILRERIRREMAHKQGLGLSASQSPLRVWVPVITLTATAVIVLFVFLNSLSKSDMPVTQPVVMRLGEPNHQNTDRVTYVIDDLDRQEIVLVSDETRQPRTISALDSMLAAESGSVISKVYQPVRF